MRSRNSGMVSSIILASPPARRRSRTSSIRDTKLSTGRSPTVWTTSSDGLSSAIRRDDLVSRLETRLLRDRNLDRYNRHDLRDGVDQIARVLDPPRLVLKVVRQHGT